MVKVINEVSKDVHLSKMQNGDIAVITSWHNGNTDYNGWVVQRTNSIVFQLGGIGDWNWNSLTEKTHPECKVRILPKGTTLQV